MTVFDRRRALLAMGSAALVSGCSIVGPALPPDRSALAGPASRMSWPLALGSVLAPLETPQLARAWSRVWARLPADKLRFLERFRAIVDAPPVVENLPRMEAALAYAVAGRHAEDWAGFLDRAYAEIFAEREFVDLAYVDGGYETGSADPEMMREWGLAPAEPLPVEEPPLSG